MSPAQSRNVDLQEWGVTLVMPILCSDLAKVLWASGLLAGFPWIRGKGAAFPRSIPASSG